MRFSRVVLAAASHETPPTVITTAAIEDRLAPVYGRLGLHPGRIELMTGIQERRSWPAGTTPSDVAVRAGRAALAASGVPAERIGLLVHASVCRDFLEPATASVVHHQLGLSEECQAFDLSNACLGVISASGVVANLIESGQIDAGLVVAGEIGAPLVDATVERLNADPSVTRKSIKASFASLTIGSGAAAFVLCRDDVAEGHRVEALTQRTATEHNDLCRGAETATGLDMRTDAEALLRAGLVLAGRTYRAFRAEWDHEPDRALAHQVGRAHTRALYEQLGLAEDLGLVTYDKLGNVGAAALPMTLSMAAARGFVQPGQRVALLGIGSGLSCAMMGVTW